MKRMISRTIVFPAVLIPVFLFPFHSSFSREPVKPKFDNPEVQALVDKAWDAQSEALSIETIDAAIAYLEKARALDPKNHVLLYMLGNEYSQRVFRMPTNTKKEKKLQEQCADKGYEYSMRSLSLKESAPGFFWAASNHAFRMQHKNFAAQLTMSPELMKLVNKTEELDITYFYGVSARLRARLALVTPTLLLKLIGGTLADIEEKLNHGIKSEPRFIDNYVDKATFVRHLGREKDSVKILEQALSLDPDAMPDMIPFNRFAHDRARAFYREWTGKEYVRETWDGGTRKETHAGKHR